MQFERRMTVVDSGIFETLDALLDDPFALCSIVTDSDGHALDCRFLRVSSGFADATGLRDAEGRTAFELLPDLDCTWIVSLGRAALDRTPLRFTGASAATGRDYEVSAAPLDPPGCFVMSFRDVTEPRRQEAERAAALARAERLLKEIGHRVMNSFASISAIVAMEARAAPPEGRDALKRVQGRVQALAALYRRLDGAPEVERLEVAGYLAGNLQSFRDSLGAPAGLAVESDLSPMGLPTRAAVPLALLLNELLTDAASQALARDRAGTLRVALRQEDGLARLVVEHGGGPLPDGVGHHLAQAFAAEIGGELAFEATPHGTRATVAFRA